MSDTEQDVVTPGRPVRLVPTPPGFWRTLLGVCIAALAPLFGFLAGSMAGSPEGEVWLEPLYWGLFVGVVVGGFGVLLAVLGGRRLWHHTRRGRDTLGPSDRLAPTDETRG